MGSSLGDDMPRGGGLLPRRVAVPYYTRRKRREQAASPVNGRTDTLQAASMLLVAWLGGVSGQGAIDSPSSQALQAEQTRPSANRGDSAAASQPADEGEDVADVEQAGLVVLDPSQGHPLILTPGDTFYFLIRQPAGVAGPMTVRMIHAWVPAVSFEVPKHNQLARAGGRAASAVLRVPPDATPGLYDLKLETQRGDLWSRRCLRIVESFRRRFRFVHLSDMNVGDLTAPEFDWTLPDEINLLNPEFIVATGDYTQWSRQRDDPSWWPRILEYFAAFHAPVFMVVGEHDHEASFTQYVASSLVGTIDYGDYHGVLLRDHFANRINQDYDQLRWLTDDLAENHNKVMNFVVTHNDELDVLDYWRRTHDPGEFVEQSKVRMIICGGHVDWDMGEFADKLDGFDGLAYIRTHQSSTCMRDKATGVSHYRVIEVDGDRVHYVYPDDQARSPAQHSVPAGRLRVFYNVADEAGAIVGRAANDGSEHRILVTVQNGLNQPFEDCRLWLKLAKPAPSAAASGAGGQAPGGQITVGGARLVRVLDGGDHLVAELAVDLPDKGAVRVMAATKGMVPSPVPVSVSLLGSRELTFQERQARFGVVYYASDDSLSIELTNRSSKPVTAWPVVRLNGTQIEVDAQKVGGCWPVVVPAQQAIVLPLKLTLGQMSEGPHLLQVYLLDDPLPRLATFPVTLRRL